MSNRILFVLAAIWAFGFSLYADIGHIHAYPEIGLKIEIPAWNSDITDHAKMWFLFAYPLVQNPTADVQYRVKLSIYKLTDEQYQRLIVQTADPSDWMNLPHLQISEQTNDTWIYIRKDIIGTNGLVFNCAARIKRMTFSTNEASVGYGPDDEKLIANLQRTLDSIEVLSTNSPNRLLPKEDGAVTEFNFRSEQEINRVKKRFSLLREKMTSDECFAALGLIFKGIYPTSSWGPPDAQSLSIMLAPNHILLTVWDMRPEKPRLVSAQLDDVKWPERGRPLGRVVNR